MSSLARIAHPRGRRIASSTVVPWRALHVPAVAELGYKELEADLWY